MRVTFMAHTAGQPDLFAGRCEIAGVGTALSLTFVSPAVEQACVDPPVCVMQQLTEQALHATTDPDRRIELVTVIWPAKGKAEAPDCEWDGSQPCSWYMTSFHNLIMMSTDIAAISG